MIANTKSNHYGYLLNTERKITMKKVISLLCVAALLVGVIAVGVAATHAASAAQTVAQVKSGDKVTYVLTLGDVPEKVIGCDFSFYYDSSVLTLDSFADFTDSTNEDDWKATVNYELKDEVVGNWSILKGVDFSKKRNFATLNFTAAKNADTHISYYVRYMYGNSAFESEGTPQIEQYTFACDLLVNGKAVLENAQPELNVEEEQSSGLFVNSVTGDSEDADVNTADNGAGSSAGNDSDNNGDDNADDETKAETSSTAVGETAATSATVIKSSTPDEGVIFEEGELPLTTGEEKEEKSSSPAVWIILILLVAAGGGTATYFVNKKKTGKSDEQ